MNDNDKRKKEPPYRQCNIRYKSRYSVKEKGLFFEKNVIFYPTYITVM